MTNEELIARVKELVRERADLGNHPLAHVPVYAQAIMRRHTELSVELGGLAEPLAAALESAEAYSKQQFKMLCEEHMDRMKAQKELKAAFAEVERLKKIETTVKQLVIDREGGYDACAEYEWDQLAALLKENRAC